MENLCNYGNSNTHSQQQPGNNQQQQNFETHRDTTTSLRRESATFSHYDTRTIPPTDTGTQKEQLVNSDFNNASPKTKSETKLGGKLLKAAVANSDEKTSERLPSDNLLFTEQTAPETYHVDCSLAENASSPQCTHVAQFLSSSSAKSSQTFFTWLVTLWLLLYVVH